MERGPRRNHDPMDVPGILGILEPGIQGGKRFTAHLWDIAPTILNLMKLPAPDDMDGKPLPVTTKGGESSKLRSGLNIKPETSYLFIPFRTHLERMFAKGRNL